MIVMLLLLLDTDIPYWGWRGVNFFSGLKLVLQYSLLTIPPLSDSEVEVEVEVISTSKMLLECSYTPYNKNVVVVFGGHRPV